MSPKELVLAQFPGRIQIPLVEAGEAIGLSRQTSYNMNSAGTFPVKVRRVGSGSGKPVVALCDIITYLEGSGEGEDQIKVDTPIDPPVVEHAPDTPPKRGRPTKREQRERAARLARWSADN